MKIVQRVPDQNECVLVRDVGTLKPFTEASILFQILPLLRETLERQRFFLVFSSHELTMIDQLAKQVAGGYQISQGLGGGKQGSALLLDLLFRPEGYTVTYVPFQDGDVPLAGVMDWPLAIQF